jgi:hypothetical protein
MPGATKIDWAAVQRDRDAGIPVSELEKKYGVSNPTIYTHTHKANGNGRAGGGKKSQARNAKAKPPHGTNGAARSNGSLSISDLVSDLRKRRDALTSAIEAIEGNE